MTEKKYVKPEKIVLNDDFTQQAGTEKSMEEVLRDMGALADIVMALESCCQMCYIKHRKRESHRSGYPQQ